MPKAQHSTSSYRSLFKCTPKAYSKVPYTCFSKQDFIQPGLKTPTDAHFAALNLAMFLTLINFFLTWFDFFFIAM